MALLRIDCKAAAPPYWKTGTTCRAGICEFREAKGEPEADRLPKQASATIPPQAAAIPTQTKDGFPEKDVDFFPVYTENMFSSVFAEVLPAERVDATTCCGSNGGTIIFKMGSRDMTRISGSR
jgi:hypothetical protein